MAAPADTPAPRVPPPMLAAIAVAALVLLAAVGISVPRTLHLYVSNQSFGDPDVNLTITVDGRVVVSQGFFVGNAHNWSLFEVRAWRGHIEVREADTGAMASHDAFPILERWLVVDFWGQRPDAPPITIEEMNHQPAFM